MFPSPGPTYRICFGDCQGFPDRITLYQSFLWSICNIMRSVEWSDSNDSDSTPGERRDHFVRSTCIRDQHIHILDGADQGGGNDSQFAGVGDHNDLLGLLDHGAKGEGFVRFVGRGSAAGVDAGDAEEKLVEETIAEEIDGGSPDQRKRPRPVEVASRQMDLEAWHVTKFHADVDRIGDDGDVAAMTQTPRHPSRGRARRQTNGLVLFDQFRSGHSDVSLLLHKAMLASLERRIVAKRLVE